MLKHLLQTAVVVGAGSVATSSYAAISLELKYTTTNESNVGTVVHDGLLQFILADNDVKVFDRADGQNKLIATRSSGEGYLFGPVKFTVDLNPNTVDLYGTYSSHVLHTHVTTDGTSTCDAEIKNRLKSDQKVYKYVYPKVGPVDVYRTTITNVSCKFSRIDDPKPEQVAAVAPPPAPPAAAPAPVLKPLPAKIATRAVKPTPEASKPSTVAALDSADAKPADTASSDIKPTPVSTAEGPAPKQKLCKCPEAKSARVAAEPVQHKRHHIVRAAYQEPPRRVRRSIRAEIERLMIMNGY